MRVRRDAAIRLLRTALVASIAIPAGVFCWGAWVTYTDAFDHADEQLNASMDVLAEQANSVLEVVALTFTSVDTIVDAMTDDQIRASETKLYDQLHELERATFAVSAIRIVDKDGHALVGSQVYPMPRDRNISDRLFPGAGESGRWYFYQPGHQAALFRAALYRSQPPPSAAQWRVHGYRRCLGTAGDLYKLLCQFDA
jgi:hypothetical protein